MKYEVQTALLEVFHVEAESEDHARTIIRESYDEFKPAEVVELQISNVRQLA